MLLPGSQLGRYTLHRRLGAGGMGDVYVAHDPTLDRLVAVKVLPDALAADSDRLARFLREARTVSALNHPNILTVYDFGQEGAIRYLVTEYVVGRTLRAWSLEGRPPLGAVLDVMAQTASALEAAHAVGIVHRDVKPENLMLRHDGLVKVLDFGIAKHISPPAAMVDSGASTTPGSRTPAGTILGTVRYMSPEQARGEPLDAHTDVWSLGVVLYELVAQRAPFEEATPIGTLAAILEREPEPLAEVAAGTPEAVCRIVAKALGKRQGERFETAAAMARALALAAQESRLGVEPDPRRDDAPTLALPTAQAGAQGDEVRSTSPAAPPPANLPPRRTALVGRERELGEITAMLRAADVRLVTLTGPGGTGKTRLAVEAARVLLAEFADGAFLVDLATLADPDLLASKIAEVFRLEESADRSLADELARHLSDKCLLLLLDNFEHLLEGAPFVSRLLAAAPGLTVLATSRALLHLRQECEYAVEPLDVPVFSSLPPLEELARASAVALFVARARDARPSFALTAENARAVAEICRRLEGLPLALELAAARLKLLSTAAMLDRLERRLTLLTGGARDLPTRQQTMRGAVAWSYELLEEEAKAALRRLAVFVGGAMLEAAEAVCISEQVDVLETVGSLVDKSLLRQREQEDGEVRFRMLEVVREYALEQLEASGEAPEARLAHARYFRRLAREAEPNLRGADQRVWFERLAREPDNLKAALSTLLDREPEEGAAFVADLRLYWLIRSHMREAGGWFARALEVASAPALRAKLLFGLSNCENRLGDLDAALPHAREAVETSRASGDRSLLSQALNTLGTALFDGGDLAGARETFAEGLAVAREVGDDAAAWNSLISLGEVARREGDLRAARACGIL